MAEQYRQISAEQLCGDPDSQALYKQRWALKTGLALGAIIPLGVVVGTDPAAATGPPIGSGDTYDIVRTTPSAHRGGDSTGHPQTAPPLDGPAAPLTGFGQSDSAAATPDETAEPSGADALTVKPENTLGSRSDTAAEIAQEYAAANGWVVLSDPTSHTVLNKDYSTVTYRDEFGSSHPPSLPRRTQTVRVNGPEIISEIDIYDAEHNPTVQIRDYVDGVAGASRNVRISTEPAETVVAFATTDRSRAGALTIVHRPEQPAEIISGETFTEGLTIFNVRQPAADALPTDAPPTDAGSPQRLLTYSANAADPSATAVSGSPGSTLNLATVGADSTVLDGYSMRRGATLDFEFGLVSEEALLTPDGYQLRSLSRPGELGQVVLIRPDGGFSEALFSSAGGLNATRTVRPVTTDGRHIISSGGTWDTTSTPMAIIHDNEATVGLLPFAVERDDRFEVYSMPPRPGDPAITAVVDWVITTLPDGSQTHVGGAVEYGSDGSISGRRFFEPSGRLED